MPTLIDANKISITGEYAEAIIHNENIEESAIKQIQILVNQPCSKDSKIRIMPDAHFGHGCVIGTTMTITDKIVPSIVGVDISCSVLVLNLGKLEVNIDDFQRLDSIIRQKVPSGHKIRNKRHELANDIDLSQLRIFKDNPIVDGKHYKAIGSLGSGNHFIEIDKGDDGNIYLVIHSGSRNLGLQVAESYQEIAKSQNINPDFPDLSYLSGQLFEDYVYDMKLMQQYSFLNRKVMAYEIIVNMDWYPISHFTTQHNYLDTDNMILRKGAVSAQNNEEFIIPFNMKDGSIICIGKGNPEWNYSAPHGAGRSHSRNKAKKLFQLKDFKKEMENEGIYSTSVNDGTLDECPRAYKNPNEILQNIKEYATIKVKLKPIYSFKASNGRNRKY